MLMGDNKKIAPGWVDIAIVAGTDVAINARLLKVKRLETT